MEARENFMTPSCALTGKPAVGYIRTFFFYFTICPTSFVGSEHLQLSSEENLSFFSTLFVRSGNHFFVSIVTEEPAEGTGVACYVY